MEKEEKSHNLSQTGLVLYGIKKMILDGQLRAGSKLPNEKDLAEVLGTSRGSLREGVRALCIMGVLETRQGDGTYVTSLDASTLLSPMTFLVDLHSPVNTGHLQTVRRILEAEAAASAALRITDEDIVEAELVLDSIENFVSGIVDVDYNAVLDADIAFHKIIARSSGNPALEAIIDSLGNRTIRSRTWRAINEKGAIPSAHRDHRSILAALRNHEPEHARLRMAIHLLNVEEFIFSQSTDVIDNL